MNAAGEQPNQGRLLVEENGGPGRYSHQCPLPAAFRSPGPAES